MSEANAIVRHKAFPIVRTVVAILAAIVIAVHPYSAVAQIALQQDEAIELMEQSPGANITTQMHEGSPPAIAVSKDGKIVGYAFSTFAVSGTLGYGGRPLDIHAGMDPEGRIVAARLAAHEEPILVIGVNPETLSAFVAGLKGLDIKRSIRVQDAERRAHTPDHVSGATVSSAVMKDAVMRSARAVASAYGLLQNKGAASSVNRTEFEPRTWQSLLADDVVADIARNPVTI